ncbi:hypothetical protein TNCV_4604371 [Trichonephila clavipes]|nr:hypothetical protein TNCV_4604371 [Trichonephila clavipes]
MTTLHLLAPLGLGQHVAEVRRSKLVCWNLMRDVLLQFWETAKYLRFEDSPQKVRSGVLKGQLGSRADC